MIGVSSVLITSAGMESNRNGANFETRYKKLMICEVGMLFKIFGDDAIVCNSSMMSEGGNSANAYSKDTRKSITNMISVGFKVLSIFGDSMVCINATLTGGNKPYSTLGVSA